MLAAGVSLVAARVWLGRGAAIGAALFFFAIRGGIAVIVGPILGQTTPYFPLYLASAVVVELIALRVSSDKPAALRAVRGRRYRHRRPRRGVGVVAGHDADPLAERAAARGRAARLRDGDRRPRCSAPGWARTWPPIACRVPAPCGSGRSRGAAVVAGLVLFGLQKPADEGVRGTISIAASGSSGEREGVVTVALDPPNAAEDAEWFQAISWQGGGLVLDDMQRHRRARHLPRRSGPVPLNDDWKTLVRLHEGNSLTGLPVYLPEDEAIPVDEVPATDGATREFIADHEILQREQLTAAPGVWAGGLRRRAADHAVVPGPDRLGPAPPGGDGRGAEPEARRRSAAPAPRGRRPDRSVPMTGVAAAARRPRQHGQRPAVRACRWS